MKFRSILVLALLSILTACGDGGAPDIDIQSPENGATFFPGDTVILRIKVTDDVGVATLNVISQSLGINVNESAPEELVYDYQLSIMLDPATPAGEYELMINSADVENNISAETLTIIVQ